VGAVVGPKIRADRLLRDPDDPAQRKEVLQYHLRAEAFWKERVAKANGD
jgi:hypothetical protein